MECFKDLIQVRDLCNAPAPKSSIYIDDVGVSLADIESFITNQYATAADYFQARSEHAVREMTNTIYNYFQGQYLATSLVDSHRLGVYNGTQTLKTGSNNYRGIQMSFNQSDTFFNVSIGEISLLVDATTTIDVEVWDLIQNKLLDSITINTVAGQISTVYLQKQYASAKQPLNLFIGYDANVDSYYTPIKSGLCCGKIACSNSYVSAFGVEVDGPMYDDNTTGLNHTSGLSVVYDVACDHQSWMCSHAANLALPLAYKTAEILVADAAYNTSGERSTNHHTINLDQLKERHGFYVNKYKEIMGNWLANMQLPNNRCFQCNTPVRHRIMLP